MSTTAENENITQTPEWYINPTFIERAEYDTRSIFK